MIDKRVGRWALLLGTLVLLALAGLYQTARAIPEQEVELCYTSSGAGQRIHGRLPGDTSDREQWAGLFNVTIAGDAQQAFCTDFVNDILEGACYRNSTVGVTDPLVACTLQHYPPVAGLTALEAAARQSVVWAFSDQWTLAVSDPVAGRAYQILADMNSRIGAGDCAAVQNPALHITPSSAVNFLAPDGSGGYLTSSDTYTLTMMAGNQPLANQPVSVSTNVGTLAWQGQMGPAVVVDTDSEGQAVFSISHNDVATATIRAQSSVSLPVGTRVDPGPLVQKIVLSGSESFLVEDTASKRWVAGSPLVMQKFHDRNANGTKDATEPLIDWIVQYRPTGSQAWTTAALGDEGTLVAGADPGQTYEVCEVTDPGWLPTTATCVQSVVPPATVVFGNIQLPALLVEKYHDLDGDGQRGPGESGLDGWGFQVARWEAGQWSSSYSGLTANGGLLGFSDLLAPFLYRVDEVGIGGWYASTPTSQQLMVDNPSLTTLQFGNLQPGQLQVEKQWYFGDLQVNPPSGAANVCVKRVGPGVPAQTLVPTDGNGTPLLPDGAGYYCQWVSTQATWLNLWPGDYAVTEAPPQGWIGPATIPDAAVASGQMAGPDNAVVVRNDALPASVSNFVWHDLNADGVQDPGEPGIEGVLVELYGGACPATGVALAGQQTNGDGSYLFDDLVPGEYCVRLSDSNFAPAGALEGYQASPQDVGPDDGGDSDGDPITHEVSVDLGPGEANPTIDFGFYQPVCLGGLAWLDSNGDDLVDPDEPAINGVLLEIRDGQGQVVTTLVSGIPGGFEPGRYRLDGLLPGPYSVTVVDYPAGLVLATPGQNATFSTQLQSGQCDLDLNYPFISTTGVAVVSLAAYRQGSGVLLRWQTAGETGGIAFHVWRASSPAGPFERVTTLPIPGSGGSGGSAYRWRDSATPVGAGAWYRLEVLPDGLLVGPVRATWQGTRIYLPAAAAQQ